MTATTSITNYEIINALTYSWNQNPTSWNGSALGQSLTITYSFITKLPSYYSTPSTDYKADVYEARFAEFFIYQNSATSLTDRQKLAFDAIVKEWSRVANITFENMGDDNENAHITLGDAKFTGNHYGDTELYLGSDFPTIPPLSSAASSLWGDVWLNNSGPKGTINLTQTQPGQDGYETILHELGHALGLNHPFGHENALTRNENQLYTTMSYTDYNKTSLIPSGWYPSKPMLYDIATIQYLYGPNTKNQADDNLGKDAYKFKTDADAIQAIWDAGGTDAIDASGLATRVTIDLQPGHFSFVGSSKKASKQQIAVAFEPVGSKDFDNTKCWIENAIGGDKNDTLTGNDAANTLEGGKGNDHLEGGPGNDTYPLQTTGGIDTILDHSGDNQIKIDGKAVSGVFRPTFDGGQIYYSTDKTYELRQMPDGDWRVSARNSGTGEYQAVADIDRWQSGEFGISLGMATLARMDCKTRHASKFVGKILHNLPIFTDMNDKSPCGRLLVAVRIDT